MRALALLGFLAASVTARAAAPPTSEALFLRGTQFVVYPVKAGETVELRLDPEISATKGSDLPTYQIIDHRSAALAPPKTFDKPAAISYKPVADGINALAILCSRAWWRVEAGSRPAMFCARPERPLHFRGKDIPLFFLPLRSAAKVRLEVLCPDKHEGATFRVYDPKGARVFEKTDRFQKAAKVEIDVPMAQRGRPWSFQVADPHKNGGNYNCDDVIVSLGAGAPPFVATDAHALVSALLAANELAPNQLADGVR